MKPCAGERWITLREFRRNMIPSGTGEIMEPSVGGSPFEVKDCGGDKCLNRACNPQGQCWFYRFRLGKGRPSVKLIQKYCLYCRGRSSELVKDCIERTDHDGVKACSLYPYRQGRNPKRAGPGGNFAEKCHVSRVFGA
jgi:hypothetical protein